MLQLSADRVHTCHPHGVDPACCCELWLLLCRARAGVAGEVGQKPDVKPRGSNIKPNGKSASFTKKWAQEFRARDRKDANAERALRRVQEEAAQEKMAQESEPKEVAERQRRRHKGAQRASHRGPHMGDHTGGHMGDHMGGQEGGR